MVATAELPSAEVNPRLPIRLEWTIQMADDLFVALEGKVAENGLVSHLGREVWEERYLKRFVGTMRQTRDKITSDNGVRRLKKHSVVDGPGLYAGAHRIGEDNRGLLVTVTCGENYMVISCRNIRRRKIDADFRISAEGVARVLKIGGGELLYAKKISEPVNSPQ